MTWRNGSGGIFIEFPDTIIHLINNSLSSLVRALEFPLDPPPDS